MFQSLGKLRGSGLNPAGELDLELGDTKAQGSLAIISVVILSGTHNLIG